MKKESKGLCILAGAGPGDIGLVTLRAREALEQAQVVVYDYLCNPEILKWAPVDAEIIFAGKKSGDVLADRIDVIGCSRRRNRVVLPVR